MNKVKLLMSTKDVVFKTLKEKNGIAVSGEELAKLCNVSRAAIWKSINSLRQEGFNIEGTPKGGYVFSDTTDTFSKALFDSYFNENFPDLKNNSIIFFKTIDSTNSYAKKILFDSEQPTKMDGTIIVADSQTAGRGRMGRRFESPAETGIYISIIYSPKKMSLEPIWISVYTAVAICRTLKKLYNITPQIKWINDIYFNEKKICGILTEGFTNFETGLIESAIIGFGLNIVENPCLKIIKENKVGAIFSQSSENKIKRCELAAELSGTVLKTLNETWEKIIEEYKSYSFLIGKDVSVKDLTGKKENYTATVIDINNQAHLVVKLSDGSTKELFSGEVSLKI